MMSVVSFDNQLYHEAIAAFEALPPDANIQRVIDIGANAGALATRAAAQGCRVLAIEPLKVDRLASNIAGLQMQRRIAIIQAVVVPEAPSEHTLRCVAADGMSGLTYRDDRTQDMGNALGITPQQILDIFGPPDFLKLDIEGGEWDLFRTGSIQPLLKASRFVDFEPHGENEFYPEGFTHGLETFHHEYKEPNVMTDLGFELLGKYNCNFLWRNSDKTLHS